MSDGVRKRSALDDLSSAVALLTAIPLNARMPRPGERSDLAGYFPAVGLLLGADALITLAIANALSVAYGDGGLLSRGSWIFAALVLVSWAISTRMLHWDGLADVGDGFWGGHTEERRLEIMADSHTGAFGASAIVLVALVEAASLAVVIGTVGMGMAVLAAPVLGRLAATFAAWLGKPAREGGLGASVVTRPSAAGVIACVSAVGLTTGLVVWQHGWVGAGVCAIGVLTAAAVPHLLAGRFGGVTGDVMGASVLLTETVVLVAAALVMVW